MKHLILVLGLFFIVGCVSQQKKAHQYFDSNRGELAEKCQDEFPNDTIKIIQGVEVIKYDTISIPGVEIECPEPTPDNPKPKVKCPDCDKITIIKERTDTVVVRDNQEITALKYKISKQQENINDLEKENILIKDKLDVCNKKKKNYFWILLLVIVSFIFLKGIKKF